MSNNLLTISQITNEGLMVLENDLCFADHVNRQYADQFALTGAKIGYTVNVRRPPRYIGTTGPALSIEYTNENYVPVTLSTQFHVDVQFTTADMATSIDMFKERVLNPVIATVANKIDRDGTSFAYQNTANAVGTPGSALSSTLTPLTAAAVLDPVMALGHACGGAPGRCSYFARPREIAYAIAPATPYLAAVPSESVPVHARMI